MKLPNKIKPFLIALSLSCAAPLSAADAEPAAWHVENAELRAPVKVDVKGALQRMPPQVYLADLPPLETCLLYTSPSPRDLSTSRMPSSA